MLFNNFTILKNVAMVTLRRNGINSCWIFQSCLSPSKAFTLLSPILDFFSGHSISSHLVLRNLEYFRFFCGRITPETSKTL